MFMFRYGIKLKSSTADAAVLKLLRKHFPNASLAELKSKVQAHDYIYLTDMEKYHQDGERRMAKLLRELDKAHIDTELFSEHCDTPASWQTGPMSREFFRNSLQQSREIDREVLVDIEREVTGTVGQEARESIAREVAERWDLKK